jgi:endonuclease III-like uncharacterized protein
MIKKMPKYKIIDQYTNVIVYERVVHIEANNMDEAREKFKEGLPDKDWNEMSNKHIETNYGTWSEIQDIEEIK